MTVRSAVRSVAAATEEAFRIAALRVILLPAAYFLPRRWGLAMAGAVSFLLLLLPRPGIPAYLEARRAFGLGYVDSLRLAGRRLARPLRDFVVLSRVLRGREDARRWRFVERNTEGVDRLRAAGESFILATAHFGRAALYPIYSPQVIPGRRIHVGAPVPSSARTLAERRARLQYATIMGVLSSAWDGGVEFVFVSPEHTSPALPLYRKLRKPGTVVYIHVDAPWEWRTSQGGAYARPFAGTARRGFAIGAARLAKLAQCPIVTCVPYEETDGTIVLEWGKPLRAVHDEIATMDTLLDAMETAIAKRPDQYVLPIGRDRRWNAQLERWEGRTASETVTGEPRARPTA